MYSVVHEQMLVPTQKWQENIQVNFGVKLCECQEDANLEWLARPMTGWPLKPKIQFSPCEPWKLWLLGYG